MNKKLGLFLAVLSGCLIGAFSTIHYAYADGIPYFDNLGEVNTGTVTGDAISKLNVRATTYQKGITITNCDSTNSLLVVPVRRGATPPTVSTTRFLNLVSANETLHVDCGGGVDWYGMNTAGDSTTSAYFVQAWR